MAILFNETKTFQHGKHGFPADPSFEATFTYSNKKRAAG